MLQFEFVIFSYIVRRPEPSSYDRSADPGLRMNPYLYCVVVCHRDLLAAQSAVDYIFMEAGNCNGYGLALAPLHTGAHPAVIPAVGAEYKGSLECLVQSPTLGTLVSFQSSLELN